MSEIRASWLFGRVRCRLSSGAAHHDVGIEEPTYFDVNEAGTQVVCSVMNTRRETIVFLLVLCGLR